MRLKRRQLLHLVFPAYILFFLMSTSFFTFLQVSGLQNDSKLISSSGKVDYPSPPNGNGQYPPASVKYFADSSYWYMKIKQNPKLHPNSAHLATRLLTQYSGQRQYPKMQYGTLWTHPIYNGYEGDPTYAVWDPLAGHYWYIHIQDPYPIWIPPESDHSVSIIDWVDGMVYHCAEIEASGGSYTTVGVMYTPIGGNGLWQGPGWGAGGSGCFKAAYMIKPEEIEAGVIHHALGCATTTYQEYNKEGSSTKNFVLPPAWHTDKAQGVLEGDVIPEGARIQLDPSIDLDSLGLSTTAKIIAKAMQDYGIVVVENGGDGFAIYCENEYTAHWSSKGISLSNLFSSLSPSNLGYNPWRIIDFELVPTVDDLSEYESP